VLAAAPRCDLAGTVSAACRVLFSAISENGGWLHARAGRTAFFVA